MFLIQEGERPQDDHNGVWLGRKGSQALAVSVIFTGLAACFVSARVYTRRYLIKHMQPNDWMVVVALVSVLVLSVPISIVPINEVDRDGE